MERPGQGSDCASVRAAVSLTLGQEYSPSLWMVHEEHVESPARHLPQGWWAVPVEPREAWSRG